MALISVEEILYDPDFIDTFKVIRRKSFVDNLGRARITQAIYPQIIGVVTNSDNNLERPEGYQIQPYSISVISNFPLRGMSQQNNITYQPDLIFWNSSYFIVKSISPYPQFGPGFYETICQSVENIDGVFLPDNDVPQLDFSNTANSCYFPLLRTY